MSPTYSDLTTTDHSQKRKVLRTLINQGKTFPIIGSFDPICAKLVEKQGLKCTYVSGSATAATGFGLPDLGIISLTETAYVAGNIASAVTIPTIADVDTGFGQVADMPKMVELFEAQGLAGIHMEDQVFPKRCGHLDGKSVISEQEMVKKLTAVLSARRDKNFVVIARVDSYSVHGFDDMLHRAQAYSDARVDMIFPEALTSLKEYEKVCKTVRVPVLANMTEFGKTPYHTVKQFAAVGVRAVLFPLSVYRSVLGAANRAIETIVQNGTQKNLIDQMLSRQAFYDLIDYATFEKLLTEEQK